MSEKCTNCDGTGWVTDECLTCGQDMETECEECGGLGEVETEKDDTEEEEEE